MATKKFLTFIIIIVVGVGVLFFLPIKTKDSGTVGNSRGLIVGRSAIYVAGQIPSKFIWVAIVRLEKPGFVVIHEDVGGVPGKILGSSVLLGVGETSNVDPINISRQTEDDETLFAMLHFDNGDGVFNPADDKPVLDAVAGEPVMMIFTTSNDAGDPGAVSL